MMQRAVPVVDRDRSRTAISIGFLRRAHELAIRRAARDAHRAECQFDALDCSVCREHADRIAQAKAALQHDATA
jgi:hypothetical protein